MILYRLFIAVAIILAASAVFWGASRLVLRTRARRGLGIAAYQIGNPAILYFTTPECVPCKTVQRPALESIREVFGESVQIIIIDASQNPTLADRWGVLSVPTTFIIDRNGRPRGVNHGVARTEKLTRQLRQMDPSLTSRQAGTLPDPTNQLS